MSATGVTSAHSVVAPSARSRRIAGAIVIVYALVTMVLILAFTW